MVRSWLLGRTQEYIAYKYVPVLEDSLLNWCLLYLHYCDDRARIGGKSWKCP
ncbi:hypothetical protein [Scytonema sp. NUACC21]